MDERSLQGARALAISATVLATGAGAHVLAGGLLPSMLGLAAIGALTLALASGLARVVPRLRVLGPIMIVLQYCLHHALMSLGTGGASSAGAHVHHADPGAVFAATAAAGSHAHDTSVTMLLAHAGAALVAAALITRSDAAARAAARWWQAVVPSVPRIAPVPAAVRALVPRGPVVPALEAPFRRSVLRRGPPGALTA